MGTPYLNTFEAPFHLESNYAISPIFILTFFKTYHGKCKILRKTV